MTNRKLCLCVFLVWLPIVALLCSCNANPPASKGPASKIIDSVAGVDMQLYWAGQQTKYSDSVLLASDCLIRTRDKRYIPLMNRYVDSVSVMYERSSRAYYAKYPEKSGIDSLAALAPKPERPCLPL